MSEPSEITGLPYPQVATQAVGMPATPRSILKPSFSRMPVRYFEVSNSWKPSSPKLKTLSDHHLRLLLHGVDLAGQIGLHAGGPFRRHPILRRSREGDREHQKRAWVVAFAYRYPTTAGPSFRAGTLRRYWGDVLIVSRRAAYVSSPPEWCGKQAAVYFFSPHRR